MPRFRFTLETLFWLMTLVCIVAAFAGVRRWFDPPVVELIEDK